MLVVLGSARARPGCRDQLLAAAREMVDATRGDDGCVSYRFAVDVTDPDLVVSVEVWRDQAALDAHMSHDHTYAFLGVAPGLVDGEPEMQFHRTEVSA